MEGFDVDAVAGPKYVRVTLRPLRSEERVQISVEYGSRVGEVRRLVEQKFGVAAPAKLLKLTKQRTYVSCLDGDRIRNDRVLHIKDVNWLQDPSVPIKSLVSRNPEAFVDPSKRKELAVQASAPDTTAAQASTPDTTTAKSQPPKGAEVGFYRVVHTHVWVRSAPNLEAKRLGLLERDRLVSGSITDDWLLLDDESRRRLVDSTARGPAWALVDGRAMGYGILLEKVGSRPSGGVAGDAPGEQAASASQEASSWMAAQALVGLEDTPTEVSAPRAPAPPGPPGPAVGAAAWLVLPEEPPSAAPEVGQGLTIEGIQKQLSSRMEHLSEDAQEVLVELLASPDMRRQAHEALELLYSYERVREMRAIRTSAPEATAPPAPTTRAAARQEAGTGEVSVTTVVTDDILREEGRRPSLRPDEAEEDALSAASPCKEGPEPVAMDPRAAARFAAMRAEDPLRLCQVFTVGWRYGEWYQETERFRQRAPFGMLRGALQEELLAYLTDRAPFSAVSEEAHKSLRHKYRLAKERFDGKDDFLKADWHTVPGLPEVADVFVPRRGARGPALRAPDHVMAFAEAFRDVNVHAWHALAARLRNGLAPKGKEELEGLGSFFAKALEENRHFGVVELQHFAGAAFEGKKHIDGCTSALHLAVSLKGKRWLRVSSAPNKTAGECLDEVYEMLPGDVYLSSPAVFQHKVIYPSCDFNNAMVSLHMRFLFEPHWWLKKWVNQLRDNDMREVASAVADTLLNQRLRLPTLAEVRVAEARLVARGKVAAHGH